MAVPPGYAGLVLRERLLPGRGRKRAVHDDDDDDDEARTWAAAAAFDAFVCWEHDTAPLRDHPLLRVAEWTALAAALHGRADVDSRNDPADVAAAFAPPMDGQTQWVAIKPGTGPARSFRLPHPRTGRPARFFLQDDDCTLLEAQSVSTREQSWFVGDSVQEDGRLVLLTPMHPVFLLIGALARARHPPSRREPAGDGVFVTLDQLLTDADTAELRQLQSVAQLDELERVCDVKSVHDMVLYRLNDAKLLAWLKERVQAVAAAVTSAGVLEHHPTAGTLELALNLVLSYLDEAWAARLQDDADYAMLAPPPPAAAPTAAPAVAADEAAPDEASPSQPAAKKRRLTGKAAAAATSAKGMKPLSSFFKPA